MKQFKHEVGHFIDNINDLAIIISWIVQMLCQRYWLISIFTYKKEENIKDQKDIPYKKNLTTHTFSVNISCGLD